MWVTFCIVSTRRAEEPGPLTRAVAAELRAEMAAQKIPTRVLAERSGVGERSLARYLNAERTFGLETLDRLTTALGITTADLVAEAQRRRRRLEPDDVTETAKRIVEQAREDARRGDAPEDPGDEGDTMPPAKRRK